MLKESNALGSNIGHMGVAQKNSQRGYAGVGPCFHLPGFHFGTGFLSHSHIDTDTNN